jgi:hypothetical protein
MRLPTPFLPKRRPSQEPVETSEGPDADPNQRGRTCAYTRAALSRPTRSGPRRDPRSCPGHPGRVARHGGAPRRPTGLGSWARAPRNGASSEPALLLSASPSTNVRGEHLVAPGHKPGDDKPDDCQQQHFHLFVSSRDDDRSVHKVRHQVASVHGAAPERLRVGHRAD